MEGRRDLCSRVRISKRLYINKIVPKETSFLKSYCNIPVGIRWSLPVNNKPSKCGFSVLRANLRADGIPQKILLKLTRSSPPVGLSCLAAFQDHEFALEKSHVPRLQVR